MVTIGRIKDVVRGLIIVDQRDDPRLLGVERCLLVAVATVAGVRLDRVATGRG